MPTVGEKMASCDGGKTVSLLRTEYNPGHMHTREKLHQDFKTF